MAALALSAPAAPSALAAGIPSRTGPAARLVAAWLGGRSPNTVAAYSRDFQDFAEYLGEPTLDAAASRLLSGDQGAANLLALEYRAAMEARGLAPATIKRRLAALRSLVKVARLLGVVPWRLDVESPRSKPLRDTRGPGLDGYRLLLRAATTQRQPAKAARDAAMLRLMGDVALRRAEVVALDVADIDFEGQRAAVIGKGSGGERAWVTLPPPTLAAIRAWLDQRAALGLPASGPLFVNADRKDGRRRITPCGVWRVLRGLGRRAGVSASRPHALRHAAITAVLDLTGGDLRTAQRFARHASPAQVLTYDDNRQDLAGEAARLLAAKVSV